MTPLMTFPTLPARDLEKRKVMLPTAFAGDCNVVLVAFQRQHQALVDSWVPWLEQAALADPRVRFYEVPTIGRLWAPVRNMIDGGMASAIGDPVILQRTFTVYGDIRRLTKPLHISERDDITVLLVNRRGDVEWMGAGVFSISLAEDLDHAIRAMASS